MQAYQAKNVSDAGGLHEGGSSLVKVWVKEFNWKAGIPNFEPAPDQTYFGEAPHLVVGSQRGVEGALEPRNRLCPKCAALPLALYLMR